MSSSSVAAAAYAAVAYAAVAARLRVYGSCLWTHLLSVSMMPRNHCGFFRLLLCRAGVCLNYSTMNFKIKKADFLIKWSWCLPSVYNNATNNEVCVCLSTERHCALLTFICSSHDRGSSRGRCCSFWLAVCYKWKRQTHTHITFLYPLCSNSVFQPRQSSYSDRVTLSKLTILLHNAQVIFGDTVLFGVPSPYPCICVLRVGLWGVMAHEGREAAPPTLHVPPWEERIAVCLSSGFPLCRAPHTWMGVRTNCGTKQDCTQDQTALFFSHF